MKIDIGCGLNKHPGFWGIDRRPLQGVDLVWDLNDPIPLPDNSVEFVMASRSLPYVDNLNGLLSELYRMCVHTAVVCILAPYAHSFAHMSNPGLKHKFDEYTPKYLTPAFFQPSQSPVCPELLYMPDAAPPFDFRLLRMELFYQIPYAPPLYEMEELEVLKTLSVNVVQEIMYHLIVIKKPITSTELEKLSRLTYPEANHAAALRTEPQP
ncbi:hypothetical protein DVH26_17070 [Paenibacillus sp. H1-7]|uniref:class I SAM-dependent methyltransferase n=1 Tax=Paenibacillus sp. H1-7 TaxID=2282849 RepID=UPI001EF98C07|nr:class I SAM-dependent methyltransferase [Paenibacillus sp. H1-7]ULL16006.1 hypothetical protein DVH26_17070 [Paenibacillus sp. H1-7]